MKTILLACISALVLFSSCGSKGSDPAPATTPTVAGTWNFISEETTSTPTTGSPTTTTRNYPVGQFTITYTSSNFQGYMNGVAQGSPSTYSISGTTYTFQDGSKTRIAQIAELTSTRFVTKESYKSGTNSVVLTSTLTR